MLRNVFFLWVPLQKKSDQIAPEHARFMIGIWIFQSLLRIPESTSLLIFHFDDLTSRQCCGSGIRCLFDPWIRIMDGKKSGYGMKILCHISQSLITLLWIPVLKNLCCRSDPGSRTRDGNFWFRDKHPGSATLQFAGEINELRQLVFPTLWWPFWSFGKKPSLKLPCPCTGRGWHGGLHCRYSLF